jgi:Flp pilus assembly protein TadB
MTTTGDVAKAILIFCCCYFLLIAVGQAISGQTVLAIFLLVGFLVPLLFVVYDYAKDKRNKKTTLNQV